MRIRPARMTTAAVAVFLGIAAFGAAAFSTSVMQQESSAHITAAIQHAGRPSSDLSMDRDRQPFKVLSFLKVQPGSHVLDILASPGYYSEILAYAVGPSGTVTAYDPPQFVSDGAARKNWKDRLSRLPNMRQLLQPLDRLDLPAAKYDLILLHLAYHETYWESAQYGLRRMNPARFVKELYQASRPGAVIGVIDHAANPGGSVRNVVDKLHRIDPAVVRSDFEKAGFVFEEASDVLRVSTDDRTRLIFTPAIRGRTDRFVMRFRKPS